MKNEKLIASWNKINANDIAHGRMLANIVVRSQKQKMAFWKMLAPVMVCVAAVLMALMPWQRGSEGEVQAPAILTPSQAVPDENTPGAPAVDPATPVETPAAAVYLYPLTLNHVSAQVEPRLFIPGHFWHGLTPAQLQGVLPGEGAGFPASATASYSSEDGHIALFDVRVVEITADGDVALFGDTVTRTTVRIAPNHVLSCAVFDFEPTVSYVQGVPVVAGVFDRVSIDENADMALFTASFSLGNIAYSIQMYDYKTGDSGLNRLTALVNRLIQNGAADLSVLDNPVIPELKDEVLSLEAARAYPGFGGLLPQNVPAGLAFEAARRQLNQVYDGILTFWHGGARSLHWHVSAATAYDLTQVVSIHQREKFDLSLYAVPLMASVPPEYSQFVMNPVFLAAELTLEAVQMRQLPDGLQITFGVLFDNMLVSISAHGLTAEEVWMMFE